MAGSQEISPVPPKASQSDKKVVQVTVEALNEVEKVQSAPPNRKLWRPFAHRTIPLIVLMVISLGLIAGLEVAVRVLPSAQLHGPGAAGASQTSSGSFTLPQTAPLPTASNSSSLVQRRQQQGAEPTSAAPTPASTTSTVPTTSEDPCGASQNAGAATSVPVACGGLPPESYVGNSEGTAVGSLPVSFEATPAAASYPTAQATTKVASGPPGGTTAVPSNGRSKPKLPLVVSSMPLALADSAYNFFLGTYAPVLIAVLLRILVTPLYRCTKLVDPFDQLTAPDGTLFRDFYLAHHLGSETIRAPYQAYQRRRWNLFWTASLYATVQAMTPLASELTQIRNSAFPIEKIGPDSWRYVFGQAVWIDSIVVRVVQGLLGLICLQLIIVWYRIWKTEPSLPGNPASIATMSALFGHPQTSRDFSRIDQRDMRITLGRFRERRYRLESYIARDGSERYGLVPKGGKIRAPPPKTENDSEDAESNKKSRWSRTIAWVKHGGKRPRGKATQQRSIAWQDVQNLSLVTIGSGTLFGLVLAYYLTSTQTAFERFMDSEQFGPRFILSLLALFLKAPLRCLWLSITAALPWRRLASPRTRGNGMSVRDVTEPVPIAITPLGGLWYALRRGEWFATGLSLAAGLAVEVLIVLLPGVPYSSKQLYIAARVSWIGCLACLSLILLVTVLGWLRMLLPQSRAAWPRPPVTVGAVGTYVAGSKMAADFAAESITSSANLPASTKFRFQQKEGRWMVDYEPENPEGAA